MHTATALAALTLLASSALAQAPSLTIIEGPSDRLRAQPLGFGRTTPFIAGNTFTPNNTNSLRPFTWRPSTGRVDYDDLAPGSVVEAIYGASSGGAQLFGQPGLETPFLWSESQGYRNLGLPAGRPFFQVASQQAAWAADDGSWVISNFGGSGARAPYRWTSGSGWQALPAPRLVTELYDVNPAGTMWVGVSADFTSSSGFIYREGQGIEDTGAFIPRAISDNGLFVVGKQDLNNGASTHAFLQSGSVLIDLGVLTGFRNSFASDVTNDGSMVVGRIGNLSGVGAAGFVWTPTAGMRTLNDYLLDFGLTFPSNANVLDIQLTGDGQTIMGHLLLGNSGSRAFSITVPSPASLIILVAAAPLAARRRR
jgi:probable HAF family extracellular repeat protein